MQETRLAEAGQVWAREVMKERNWSIVFGQPLEAQRSAWEAKPGGVAIAAGPGVELQKAPLTSARERALHDTGRKRALITHGKGDRLVHVVSLFGHARAGDIAERWGKTSSC